MDFKTIIRENVYINIKSFIINEMKYTEEQINLYMKTDYEAHSHYALNEFLSQIYLKKYGYDTTTFNEKIEAMYKYFQERIALHRYNFYLNEVFPYLKYLHNILHDIFNNNNNNHDVYLK